MPQKQPQAPDSYDSSAETRKSARQQPDAVIKASASGRTAAAALASQNFDQPLDLGEPLPQLTGWASTTPGVTRWHYYDKGVSSCNYQRKAAPLVFAESEAATESLRCSSCENNIRKASRPKATPQHILLARLANEAPRAEGLPRRGRPQKDYSPAPAAAPRSTTSLANPTDRQAILDGNPT